MTLEEYHKKVVNFIKKHEEYYTVVALDRFWHGEDDPEKDIPEMVRIGFSGGFTVEDVANALMIELGRY